MMCQHDTKPDHREPHSAQVHDHGRCGDHALRANQRRLTWMLGLVVAYMAVEVVGGILSNSLALLADAGHMLSDAGAIALALFATWIARRPPTSRNTYGYRRTEILAALANGASLIGVSVWIVVEALRRIGSPPEVDVSLMAIVATGGLVVNLIGLAVLHGGAHHNLNVRGAWLHVLGDALGSVSVIVAAGLVWAFGWYWMDAAVSVVVAAIILTSSWSLLREAVGILMEAAPAHIDMSEVRRTILSVPGVLGLDRLHVWTISSGVVALSAHVAVVRQESLGEVLGEIRRSLRHRFGVEHITIQPEPEGVLFECCRMDGLQRRPSHVAIPAGG